MNRTKLYKSIAFENGKSFLWNAEEYKYLMYRRVLELDLREPNALLRAEIEKEILENLTIEINDFELLVGRPANGFSIDKEKREIIDKGWKVEHEMGDECPFKNSQTNHRAIDYEMVLKGGLGSILKELDEYEQKAKNKEQKVFYEAAKISLNAVCTLAKRYRKALLKAAKEETNAHRREELLKMAENFKSAPYAPCKHFYEALQCVWFLQFCFKAVDDVSLTGRTDRYLYPYYEADIASGYIKKDFAFELIEQFFFKHNELYDSWPCAIMLGGTDKNGKTVCNDLTYMMLDAVKTTGLVNPAVSIAYTSELPQAVLDKSLSCIKAGLTRPAFFNDALIQEGLIKAGVSREEAHNYVHSACVEITVVGASDILVATPYINLTRAFEYILSEKKLPYNIGMPKDIRVGWGGWGVPYYFEETDFSLDNISSFEEFFALLKRVLFSMLKAYVTAAYRLAKTREKNCSSPLFSALTKECRKQGKDISRAAKYDFIYPCFPGFINLIDSAAAIKRAVFDEKKLSLLELGKECGKNFENETIRQYLINKCPKFGNNDEEADKIGKELYDFVYEALKELSKGQKRKIYPSYFAWKAHGIMGKETPALPDGRRAGEALSENLGAVQGRDKKGPTAVVASISKLDQSLGIGGIATNFKFSSDFLRKAEGEAAVKSLIRYFMQKNCFEVQLNAVSREVLEAAQKNPEKYSTLLVRVAGFSDYFVRLDRAVQNEIIKRTEYN